MTHAETEPTILDLDDEFKEEWVIRSSFLLKGMDLCEAVMRFNCLGYFAGGHKEETRGIMTLQRVVGTQQEALDIAAQEYKAHLGEFATGGLLIRSAMSLQLMVDLAFDTCTYPDLPAELIVTPHLQRLLDE